ncbi:hypothetical protein GCM10009587_02140 [Microbacterium maritypicum]
MRRDIRHDCSVTPWPWRRDAEQIDQRGHRDGFGVPGVKDLRWPPPRADSELGEYASQKRDLDRGVARRTRVSQRAESGQEIADSVSNPTVSVAEHQMRSYDRSACVENDEFCFAT